MSFIKDYGLLALNTLGSLASRLPGNVGWDNFNQSSTRANKLTPTQQLAEVQKDKRSILASITLNAADLPSATSFDEYINGRIKSSDGFTSVAQISTTLKAAAAAPATQVAAKAATDEINHAIELLPETGKAQKEFTKLLKTIHEEFSKTPKIEINGLLILKLIQKEKTSAIKAIEAQHAKDVKNLGALFKEPPFIANLKASLGIDDAGVNKVHTEMVAALNASHKKQLEDFNKAHEEPLKKVHEALQKQRDTVFLLATLAANSDSVNKAIHKKYYERKRAEGKSIPAVTIQSGNKNPRAIFKDITIDDLEAIQTATGRTLTKNPDGSYYMDLPNRLFGFAYYYSSHENLKADFLTMANAIHCKHDKIKMTITNDDPEFAMKLGRAAYAACLETGFDPKTITIMVNGEAKTADQLFAEHPSELAAAKDNAAKYSKERKQWDDTANDDVTIENLRDALVTGRTLQSEVDKEEAEVQPTSSPHTI